MKVDTEKVVQHLVATWGKDRACPMCGHKGWAVSEMIVEMREFQERSLFAERNVFPAIPVTCANCATSQFVNAVQIGLVSTEGGDD